MKVTCSRPPLTLEQRRVVVLATMFIAMTRLAAAAQSLWDWDEANFALAIRDYDVADWRPHPPGYPLFVAAAKLFSFAGLPDFRALQLVVLLSAALLFPTLFFLAREIGFPFATSVGGAAIFAFLPNVWVYGGTAFSDVPATVIAFGACSLLLRGRHDARAYLWGAGLLGVAVGVRPTGLLIGLVPAAMATYCRARASLRVAIAGAVLGGLIAGSSYGGAAVASRSIPDFLAAIDTQSKWVRDVDSYHNSGRPRLIVLASSFLYRPVKQSPLMAVLATLAMISLLSALLTRRSQAWLTLAIFGPMAVIAWLCFDFQTAGRYAVSYMALHALLAADGIAAIVAPLAALRPSLPDVAHRVLCSSLVCALAAWAWPALSVQRTTEAPPVAALEWARRNVPATATVYISAGIVPQSDYFLPQHRKFVFDKPGQIPLTEATWIVDERVIEGGASFVRSRRGPLWRIVRQRGFEVSVARARAVVVFGEGWYGEERDGGRTWRWMTGESTTYLPAVPSAGTLHLKMHPPMDLLGAPPTIAVWFNGRVLERLIGSPVDIERTWTLESTFDGPNELRIVTDATANPSRLGRSTDTRDLGLRVDVLSWRAAR